jgi:aminoglycoside phosphotransferase (APT) family kinase protein
MARRDSRRTRALTDTVGRAVRGWRAAGVAGGQWPAWRRASGCLRTAAAEQVFVHGDYQHFNVLWCNGRLSGVVDWPNAGTGSRGGDVGHCRLNLAVLFGPGAAAEYLAAYESVAAVFVDRRADLRALLSFDLAWRRFIPRQIAGRARLDVPGMPGRVAATVQNTLDGSG